MIKQDYVHSMSKLLAWFDWLPPPLASSMLLVVAALIALLFSRLIREALPRLPGLRRVAFIHETIGRSQNHVRLLLMIVAAGAALPATTGFSPDTIQFLAHFFAFMFIVTIGFGLIRAFRFGTDKYLERIANHRHVDDITVRSHQTQIRVLRRLIEITCGVITIGAALMVFESVRQYGVSLFASAGAASLVVGLSARPALSNLIAGIQIAITQPIRMEDMLILNGDWAYVEEINATYVVLRTWDRRRYIVPIAYFLENPFQNWTHSSSSLIGSLFLWLDYQTPVDEIRRIFVEELAHCPDWDHDMSAVGCQVADSNAQVISLRLIAGAKDANGMWNLCCDLRERILKRVREDLPQSLPRGRTAIVSGSADELAWPDSLLSPAVNHPASSSHYNGPDIRRTP